MGPTCRAKHIDQCYHAAWNFSIKTFVQKCIIFENLNPNSPLFLGAWPLRFHFLEFRRIAYLHDNIDFAEIPRLQKSNFAQNSPFKLGVGPSPLRKNEKGSRVNIF
jgi:hypothetical protein